MARGTPWLIALVCAMAGGGIWAARYGANHTSGVEGPRGRSPEEMVRLAVTQGRHVALRGSKEVAGEGVKKVRAQVVNASDGRLHIEFSEPLKGVKIWDNGERVYRFNPRQNRLTVARKHRTREDRQRMGEQLARNYDARRVGLQTVAGRPAEVIELHPRRAEAHAQAPAAGKSGAEERWERLWIDPHTWVILAKEDLRGRDRVIRSTRFTKIAYLAPGQEPSPSEFEPPADLVRRYGLERPGAESLAGYTPEQLSKRIGFPVRLPTWLPKGYALEAAYETPCYCSRRHMAARLEYSDGLNTISLFECAHPACTSADNCFAADGRTKLTYRYRQSGASYLAVGEASREDLERIVKSAAG